MPDTILARNLHTTLHNAVYGNNTMNRGKFFAMTRPGLPIDVETNENDPTSLYMQSNILDRIIDVCYIARPKGGTVSATYAEWLDNTLVPNATLDDAARLRLQRLENRLAEIQPTYNNHRRNYERARRAYKMENNKPPGIRNEARVAALLADCASALEDWNTTGRRMEYENIAAQTRILGVADTARTMQRLNANFNGLRRPAPTPGTGTFVPTLLNPAVNHWNNENWTKIRLDVNDTDLPSEATEINWNGGTELNNGLWSVGGAIAGGETQNNVDSNTSRATIEMELLRVGVERDWLNMEVLTSGVWAWRNTHPNEALSAGYDPTTHPPRAPHPRSLMPIIGVEILVARNIRLNANFTRDRIDEVNKLRDTRVACGWGPFSITGNYRTTSREKQVSSREDNNVIVVETPQIVGFLCRIMPTLPNPDLSLPWPEKPRAVVDDPNYAAMVAEANAMETARLRAELQLAEERRAIMDMARNARIDAVERSRQAFRANLEEELRTAMIAGATTTETRRSIPVTPTEAERGRRAGMPGTTPEH